VGFVAGGTVDEREPVVSRVPRRHREIDLNVKSKKKQVQSIGSGTTRSYKGPGENDRAERLT